MSSQDSDQSGIWAQVGLVAGLGFVLFSSIGGGYFFGWWLDRRFGTTPLFGLILAGLGLGLGLFEILKIIKRTEKSGDGNGN